MNGYSVVTMANPGWHHERLVEVAELVMSWRANGAGRASFHLPARKAHLLGFPALLGRWVRAETPVGTWAGFVEDTPSQIANGIIELSCNDMTGLLETTITPRTYRQTSSSAGALISRAITDSGVDSGSWFQKIIVDEDGAPLTVEWRGEQTSRVVQSLARSGGGYWGVSLESGKTLTFTYKAAAEDRRSSILLIEGVNVVDGSISPSISQLVNDILGIANDRYWQQAAGARVYDETSIRLYDRRRETRRYQGHTRKSSLETVARADLAASSLPSGPVSLDIVDTNPVLIGLRHSQLVRLWSYSQNRIYDLTILGLSNDTVRGIVTIVGTVVEAA